MRISIKMRHDFTYKTSGHVYYTTKIAFKICTINNFCAKIKKNFYEKKIKSIKYIK